MCYNVSKSAYIVLPTASLRKDEDDAMIFGDFIRIRREELGKTLRGLAAELDITPAYLSDIEKGNRPAPEKFLDKFIELLAIPEDRLNEFYDLAGKSRNNQYPDLNEYIGQKDIARLALRRARDMNITDARWQAFIDDIDQHKL
jgi:transcriptional regulator with XRE-family HTH domain